MHPEDLNQHASGSIDVFSSDQFHDDLFPLLHMEIEFDLRSEMVNMECNEGERQHVQQLGSESGHPNRLEGYHMDLVWLSLRRLYTMGCPFLCQLRFRAWECGLDRDCTRYDPERTSGD